MRALLALLVASAVLAGGCNCQQAIGCDWTPAGDWDTSAATAGDLWESEQARGEGEVAPDTIAQPTAPGPDTLATEAKSNEE